MTDNPAFSHPGIDGIDATDPQADPGQPEERLLARKYKSVDELERGYDNLFSEGQRLVERVRELEARLQNAPQEDWLGEGEVAERVSPADRRAARQDPVDALAMAGIPVNELGSFVRRAVQQEIDPFFKGASARQTVVADYPDFAQFEGELAQFVEANPQLKARYHRAYAADPEVALKWAYGEFNRSRGAPRVSASGEAQAAARLDASLPGRVAPSRQTLEGDQANEEYRKLREEALRTGDWSKALAFKLQGTIPQGHLESLG